MRNDGGRRTGAALVLAGALAVLGTACSDGDGSWIETGGGGGGGSGALVSVGPVPDPVRGAPEVELTRCEWDDDLGVLVEGVVTNGGDGPAILQGVPVTISIGGEVVVDEESGEELWSSATIGPGRQTLVRDAIDVDVDGAGAGGEPECQLGDADLRPTSYDDVVAHGEPLGRDDVELTGCSGDAVLRLHNPSSEPVAILAAVEFFDEAGHSAGTLEIGQVPTTYTNGQEPAANEVALPAGEWGEHPTGIEERIADWDTPLDGGIASCQVVAAGYVPNPDPVEVVVD
jgi:hypothetical protein